MTGQGVTVIAPTSRTARVVEVLKTAILNGDFPAGAALVEADLAQRLGVSKTPVREALKSLESSGLVVIRPYAGVRVRSFGADEARGVYELRLLIEPEAVRQAIRAGIDTDAASSALHRADAAPDDSTRSEANRDFHRAMYSACPNALLVETLDGLRDRTAMISATAWGRAASWGDEADEHRQILEAALAGDADAAAHRTAAHIEDFLHRRLHDTDTVAAASDDAAPTTT